MWAVEDIVLLALPGLATTNEPLKVFISTRKLPLEVISFKEQEYHPLGSFLWKLYLLKNKNIIRYET